MYVKTYSCVSRMLLDTNNRYTISPSTSDYTETTCNYSLQLAEAIHIESDTAKLFAATVLETPMLPVFQVGANPLRSIFFWAISYLNYAVDMHSFDL